MCVPVHNHSVRVQLSYRLSMCTLLPCEHSFREKLHCEHSLRVQLLCRRSCARANVLQARYVCTTILKVILRAQLSCKLSVREQLSCGNLCVQLPHEQSTRVSRCSASIDCPASVLFVCSVTKRQSSATFMRAHVSNQCTAFVTPPAATAWLFEAPEKEPYSKRFTEQYPSCANMCLA